MSFELVSLGTKLVDLVQHPLQQRFRCGYGDARPLQLSDFTALSVDLAAHPLDFEADKIKLHGVPVRPRPFRSAEQQRRLIDPLVRGFAGGSKGV
jgi:hypothetical protein